MDQQSIPYSGPIVTLADALASGATRYFTGEACKGGHVAQRMVSNRSCVVCLAEKTDARRTTPQGVVKRNARRRANRQKNPEAERAYGRTYYAANAEKLAADMRQYRKDHPDRVAASKRRTYDRHYDKIIVRNHLWEIRNPDKCREYGRRTRAKHGAKILARQIVWGKANPEKLSAARRRYRLSHPWVVTIQNARRRSRKLNAGGTFTAADLMAIYAAQGGKCAICRKRITGKPSPDHIIPLALGGSNDKRNIQATHLRCNLTKRDKDPITFMQEIGFLL